MIAVAYLKPHHYNRLNAARAKALLSDSVQQYINSGLYSVDWILSLSNTASKISRLVILPEATISQASKESEALKIREDLKEIFRTPSKAGILHLLPSHVRKIVSNPYKPDELTSYTYLPIRAETDLTPDEQAAILKKPSVLALFKKRRITLLEFTKLDPASKQALTNRHIRSLMHSRHLSPAQLAMLKHTETIDALTHGPAQKLFKQRFFTITELDDMTECALKALKHPMIRRLLRDGFLTVNDITDESFDEFVLQALQHRRIRQAIRRGETTMQDVMNFIEADLDTTVRKLKNSTPKEESPKSLEYQNLLRKTLKHPMVQRLIRQKYVLPSEIHGMNDEHLKALLTRRVRLYIKKGFLSVNTFNDLDSGQLISLQTMPLQIRRTAFLNTLNPNSYLAANTLDTALNDPDIKRLIKDRYLNLENLKTCFPFLLEALCDRSHPHHLAWLIRHGYITQKHFESTPNSVLAALGTPEASSLVLKRYQPASLGGYINVGELRHANPNNSKALSVLLTENPDTSLIENGLFTTGQLSCVTKEGLIALQDNDVRALFSATLEPNRIFAPSAPSFSKHVWQALTDPNIRELILHGWIDAKHLMDYKNSEIQEEVIFQKIHATALKNKHIQTLIKQGYLTATKLRETDSAQINGLMDSAEERQTFKNAINSSNPTPCNQNFARVLALEGITSKIGKEITAEESRHLPEKTITKLSQTDNALRSRSKAGLFVTPAKEDADITADDTLAPMDKAKALLLNHYGNKLNTEGLTPTLVELRTIAVNNTETFDDTTRETLMHSMNAIRAAQARAPQQLTNRESLALLFLAMQEKMSTSPENTSLAQLVHVLANGFCAAKQQESRFRAKTVPPKALSDFRLATAFDFMKSHIPELESLSTKP